MTAAGARLWGLLLGWQLVRLAVLVFLIWGPLQRFSFWIVMAWYLVEFSALKRIHAWAGIETNGTALVGRGDQAPRGLALVCMILYLCAPAFVAAIPLIDGTSVQLAEGPRVGPVAIADAALHRDAAFIEFSEGGPRAEYLGAVRYQQTARVKEHFYALPYVTNSWTPDEAILVWAIVNESEMSNVDLPNWRFGNVVRPDGIHADAFRAAIANAEDRSQLRSEPDFVMVRLLPAISTGWWSRGSVWVMLILATSWAASFLYCRDVTRPAGQRTVDDSPAVAASLDRPQAWFKSGALQRRRTWGAIHVGGYGAIAVLLLNSGTPWISVPFILLVPLAEGWLIFQTFKDRRESGRTALVFVLFPLSMLLALICLGFGSAALVESRALAFARPVTDANERCAPGEYLEFTTDRVLRNDVAGVCFAPTEEADSWWLIPAVDKEWDGEAPVTYWLRTTNRTRDRDVAAGAHFGRVPGRSDFRTTTALADAVARHGITSDKEVVVYVSVPEPAAGREKTQMLTTLGALLCLGAWMVCAMFWVPWPRSFVAAKQ